MRSFCTASLLQFVEAAVGAVVEAVVEADMRVNISSESDACAELSVENMVVVEWKRCNRSSLEDGGKVSVVSRSCFTQSAPQLRPYKHRTRGEREIEHTLCQTIVYDHSLPTPSQPKY